MELLVFADTHGRPQRMLEVAALHSKTASAAFYLGDGTRDAEQLAEAFPSLPLYTVQGNCDLASFDPEEGLAPFGGLLVFYTHGHTLGVKQDLESLWWRAKRQGADIALFGHTHVPHSEFRNGIYLFNPGSLAMPRFGSPTYGLITIAGGQPTFEIRTWQKPD